jgi:serine/threonine protein phosphatase PrpC
MAFFDWLKKLFGGGAASAATNGQAGPDGAARPFRIRVGQHTDKGRRDNNEDNLFVSPERQLFIVADGMGGQAAGEVASALAIDAIPAKLADLSSLADEDAARDIVKRASSAPTS